MALVLLALLALFALFVLLFVAGTLGNGKANSPVSLDKEEGDDKEKRDDREEAFCLSCVVDLATFADLAVEDEVEDGAAERLEALLLVCCCCVLVLEVDCFLFLSLRPPVACCPSLSVLPTSSSGCESDVSLSFLVLVDLLDLEGLEVIFSGEAGEAGEAEDVESGEVEAFGFVTFVFPSDTGDKNDAFDSSVDFAWRPPCLLSPVSSSV